MFLAAKFCANGLNGLPVVVVVIGTGRNSRGWCVLTHIYRTCVINRFRIVHCIEIRLVERFVEILVRELCHGL